VVLLRKSIPQNHNLKAAAELNVMWATKLVFTASGDFKNQKQKQVQKQVQKKSQMPSHELGEFSYFLTFST
jgi:hypothetical protein